jgi:hypothetical protein
MIESITVITVLLTALNRVDLQTIFDHDGYESRRSTLPGARLVKVLVVYQMIHTAKLRGLIRTITEHTGLQAEQKLNELDLTKHWSMYEKEIRSWCGDWTGLADPSNISLKQSPNLITENRI